MTTSSREQAGTLTPFDLVFAERHRCRPYDLLAPRFIRFDSAHDRRSPDLTGGEAVSTGTGPRAPFAAVVADLRGADPDAGLALGLAGEGTAVLGVWDAATARVHVEVTAGGTTTEVASAPVPAVPSGLAVAVNENAVTVLVRTEADWEPVLTERDGVRARVDLRRPEVLAGLEYTCAGRGAGTVRLERVRAGYFGQAGVRDPHLVQYPDGRPYIRDGKVYLTMTNAGLGFFQQAHWAVWTLDLADPTRLEQVAALFFERDGLVLGDHAGQIVYDDERDRYIVLVSSWGDFAFEGVHVLHTTTGDDVLTGVHVLRPEPCPLPTTVSSWDPALTRVDGRWRLAFVESPAQRPEFDFHPALAEGPPGADYAEDLRLVGADTDVTQTEGVVIQRVGAQWHVLASDGHARTYPVYDLRMRKLGTLDAPYGTNIPHPVLFPVGDQWWLLTFDGTQLAEPLLGYGSHGDFIVMTADSPR